MKERQLIKRREDLFNCPELELPAFNANVLIWNSLVIALIFYLRRILQQVAQIVVCELLRHEVAASFAESVIEK